MSNPLNLLKSLFNFSFSNFQVWVSLLLPNTASNPPFLTYPRGNSIQVWYSSPNLPFLQTGYSHLHPYNWLNTLTLYSFCLVQLEFLLLLLSNVHTAISVYSNNYLSLFALVVVVVVVFGHDPLSPPFHGLKLSPPIVFGLMNHTITTDEEQELVSSWGLNSALPITAFVLFFFSFSLKFYNFMKIITTYLHPKEDKILPKPEQLRSERRKSRKKKATK